MGKTSIYGLPRREIKGLGIPSTLGDIDTMALYRSVYYIDVTEVLYKDSQNSYPYTAYLKFYSNGKLGLFVIPKKDTLDLKREYFDPLQAKMGYYTIENNTLKTKISTIGDCSLYISKEKGTIKGDTIILRDINHRGGIYIKEQVPKELLENWVPDW